ncbi:hypothetical protein GCM10010406_27310 [Streptomyces thermolineatus]|uniref:Uncharacterized protein n=1 Tax=Streptomyces thermolineatus TaxID=44033 RepID=A0ABN3LSZ0_9ACTN
MTDAPQDAAPQDAAAPGPVLPDSLPPGRIEVDDDWFPDPLAGVPAAVIDLVGAYDHDTAGGCG